MDGDSFIKNMAKGAMEGLDSVVKNASWDDKKIFQKSYGVIADQALNSNKPINPINSIGTFILGERDTGIRGVLNNLSSDSSGMTFGKAISNAYQVGEGESKRLNYKAIAGTYVGASLAGRAISGGGIYRDSNGNANLPVVPFV